MKLLVAVLVALIAMPAGAADFVFNVPVKLNNLDARVTSLLVVCSISSPSSNIGLGSGRVSIPASGNYSGTVRVEVSARAGQNPAAANRYQCELATEAGSLDGPGVGPEYASRPGTSSVFRAAGTVTR